jgi:PAS domain S-box-containing protein
MKILSSSPASASISTPVSSDGHVKLLLVDDDSDNLLALQAVLEPLHEDLMLANSGTEALRLCLDHDFAAILLDVRMPEMDGFETAEMIRSRKRSRHTPILFLTAYRSDEQLFRGYDLGAVDYLFKPIVPEVLQSKVNVFVELSRSDQLLRRQTEELRRTERKFRAVLEAAPDAMMITTREGIIELANSRADALFGYPREALIGRSIASLIPEWEPPEERPESVAPGSQPAETRLTGIRENGAIFPAEITRNPFKTGESVLVTTAIRDATDQVKAETRVQRTNLELEKRVSERTVELTRSNEALRQFAWAASHDFQEPIRTMLSYSQWLAELTNGSLGEREAQMLGFIEQQAHRMHQLLGGLQEYIRVSESGQEDWAEVDCDALAAEIISNLRGMIDDKGATVECGPLPTITSIQILLVQLFQNLISNGIRYRSEKPPLIRISAEPVDGGWIFSVGDNGIGIDPKYFDYIFGVFRRLHGIQYSGTGIGLAICRAAVERLGGRIWVESTLGSGSNFRFFLPWRPDDDGRTDSN